MAPAARHTEALSAHHADPRRDRPVCAHALAAVVVATSVLLVPADRVALSPDRHTVVHRVLVTCLGNADILSARLWAHLAELQWIGPHTVVVVVEDGASGSGTAPRSSRTSVRRWIRAGACWCREPQIMNKDTQRAWVNEALDTILEALASRKSIRSILVFKGARVLNRRLESPSRQSYDADVNILRGITFRDAWSALGLAGRHFKRTGLMPFRCPLP